ncbi:MAG: uridine diphosphate-N-acetylglucosamine-binding protein YvcK [Candidatus Omnitrophica bacterium]|nr:uridine diphosphate-N-acetylglucosamine-binding protein YvcK [Candidatus Omnitrophota bacterium]
MSKNFLKWLYPGIQIKRWVLIALLGVGVVALGSYFAASPYHFVKAFGFVIVLCGILFLVLGILKLTISLITLFLPRREQDLVNILYQKRYLERGPKIVAIGGGHGLSNLLLALKEYTSNITAIVTVADSGGSSGRLREQFDIVAPGDIRNCLVALADAPALMGELFQYRFPEKSELKGHNFGNLFLTALYEVGNRDFSQAVELTSKVLAIRGTVIPSTVDNVHLVAQYEDGSVTQGEAKIPRVGVKIEKLSLNPEETQPTPDAIEAIKDADVIIIGPGSLYTSILPNLIIRGLPEAIAASSAFKIYVCNVMTQAGETEGFTASDHVRVILQHALLKDMIDAVIVSATEISATDALDRYKRENSFPVLPDTDAIRAMGYKVFAEDIVGIKDYVRHDSTKLTQALIKVIEKNRLIKR